MIANQALKIYARQAAESAINEEISVVTRKAGT